MRGSFLDKASISPAFIVFACYPLATIHTHSITVHCSPFPTWSSFIRHTWLWSQPDLFQQNLEWKWACQRSSPFKQAIRTFNYIIKRDEMAYMAEQCFLPSRSGFKCRCFWFHFWDQFLSVTHMWWLHHKWFIIYTEINTFTTVTLFTTITISNNF